MREDCVFFLHPDSSWPECYLCYECGMASFPDAAKTGLSAWPIPGVTTEPGPLGLLCSDPPLSFLASAPSLCAPHTLWLCCRFAEQGSSGFEVRGDSFL